MEEKINNSKLYELVLHSKIETEKNRDEINKYYTSLFTALVSLAPFLDKFTSSVNLMEKYNIKYALLLLSSLGLILSFSWELTLKRIHTYLQGMDELLIILEKQSKISFISHMAKYLDKTHAPARVTKHQIIVPYAFFIIFTIIFIYSIMSLLGW